LLVSEGCVFQERHGWERPGWFNKTPINIAPYDWYGAYGNDGGKKNDYRDALNLDYTFGYPKMHDLVSLIEKMLYFYSN
jgi:sarcosine dehydrogenase